MGSMAQTGLLLVPSDALGHTWALPVPPDEDARATHISGRPQYKVRLYDPSTTARTLDIVVVALEGRKAEGGFGGLTPNREMSKLPLWCKHNAIDPERGDEAAQRCPDSAAARSVNDNPRGPVRREGLDSPQRGSIFLASSFGFAAAICCRCRARWSKLHSCAQR